MNMSCKGIAVVPASPVKGQEWQLYTVAQLWCQGLFAEDFLRRHPGGVVTSEREPLEIGYTNHATRKVLDALASDFRSFLAKTDKGIKNRLDMRKADALGISASGEIGELLEVTTENRYLSKRDYTHAAIQLDHKLDTLKTTVNPNNGLTTQWLATPWKPAAEAAPPLPSAEGVRWLCFRPSHRHPKLEQGIALYEIHELQELKRYPAPVAVPKRVQEMIRDAIKETPLDSEKQHPIAWGLELLKKYSQIAMALTALLAAVGLALLAATLLAAPLSLSGLVALALALATLLAVPDRQRLPPPA